MCRQVGSQPHILASFAFTKCCACFFDLCGHHICAPASSSWEMSRHISYRATINPRSFYPSPSTHWPTLPLCTTCDGCCRRTAIVSRRINIRPTRTRHKGPLRAEAKILVWSEFTEGKQQARSALARSYLFRLVSLLAERIARGAHGAVVVYNTVSAASQQESWMVQASLARLGGDQTPCAGRMPWAWILGRTHRHIAVSSPVHTSRAIFQGRSLGRSGWAHGCSRRSGPIARAVCCASQMAYLVLMRKRGDWLCKSESHMRDLGRYVGAFQIAGFGPCLCATLAFFAFCFSCMLQPSTDLCAYTARGD